MDNRVEDDLQLYMVEIATGITVNAQVHISRLQHSNFESNYIDKDTDVPIVVFDPIASSVGVWGSTSMFSESVHTTDSPFEESYNDLVEAYEEWIALAGPAQFVIDHASGLLYHGYISSLIESAGDISEEKTI